MTRSLVLVLAGLAASVYAQPAGPPAAYTVVQTSAMSGPGVSQTIYRSGPKAVIDLIAPAGGPYPNGLHLRTLYDLQSHKTFSWDLEATPAQCSGGTFSGDWGDPFATASEVTADLARQQAHQTGTDIVAGMTTNRMEAALPGGAGRATAWIEPRSGLVMKMEMTPANGARQTMLEIARLTISAPPAAVFALPASCAAVAAAPTEADRIAAETGGNAADFANAIMPPASKNSCAVSFRIVRAGSMETISSGVQVAVDLTVDVDHPAKYVMGRGANGRATFSGGGLHETTAQMKNGVLRLDNVPAQFNLELAFGAAGDASALVYRQCAGPQTVLLFVVKNPAKISDGGDWLWVKSGKYATPPTQ
jgi:hypothetical protein